VPCPRGCRGRRGARATGDGGSRSEWDAVPVAARARHLSAFGSHCQLGKVRKRLCPREQMDRDRRRVGKASPSVGPAIAPSSSIVTSVVAPRLKSQDAFDEL